MFAPLDQAIKHLLKFIMATQHYHTGLVSSQTASLAVWGETTFRLVQPFPKVSENIIFSRGMPLIRLPVID